MTQQKITLPRSKTSDKDKKDNKVTNNMLSLVRGSLFNGYLLVLTLTMGLGALPIRLLRRRALALRYAKAWSRAVLWGLESICSVRIEVEGRAHLGAATPGAASGETVAAPPFAPLLVVSQHQSFFDGFIWMLLLNHPAYVIKKELTRLPFVGPMLVLSGMIAVDRHGGPQALRAMMDKTAQALEGGRQIILFPEGTRTLPGVRAPLQAGVVALARQAKSVPIVPVVTNSGQFWPRSPWRKYPGVLKVVIGPPLPPSTGRALLGNIDAAWDKLCHEAGLARAPLEEPASADGIPS